MFILLGMLSPKTITFHFFDIKLLCKNSSERLASQRKAEIVVATFLVEYVVAIVVG